MKNVLIISSTPRRGGNTDVLGDEFAKGAKEAGTKEMGFILDQQENHFRPAVKSF